MSEWRHRLRMWLLGKLGAVNKYDYDTLLDGYMQCADGLTRSKKQVDELTHGINEIAKVCGADHHPCYSWQRVWQTVARIVHGLPPDAPIEDLKLAEMFKEPK